MGFWPALGVMAFSFAILAKCADWLVEGAIEIAAVLRAPPILVGIVIVGIGTTTPELAVSITAALDNSAEMALGNAVGSVIYDDGIALPLAAFFARYAIPVDRTVLRSAALFLIVIDLLAYYMCADGTLERFEGGILVLLFVCYLGYTYWEQKRQPRPAEEEDEEDGQQGQGWGKIALYFAGGLAGVIISSEWIVGSAKVVATDLGVSEAIISLALVALGTSIPEIATGIIAARKGQGSLAVGNILGADILNICWIAGASALVNPLTITLDQVHFIFPAMLIIVFAMLLLLRLGHQLNRWKAGVLLGLFAIYMYLLVTINPGGVMPPS
jgi:cation:H+ antiporter